VALFQSPGRVPLLVVMSSSRARYGIMASPPSFSISLEIQSDPTDLFFPIAAILFLMIFTSMVKGSPEFSLCICEILPSLLNTDE